MLYALWKHIFHIVPEKPARLCLLYKYEWQPLFQPRANTMALVILLLLLRLHSGTAFCRNSVKKTTGTGIDLALINHCTMIHGFCQTVCVIYDPLMVECGHRGNFSWACSAKRESSSDWVCAAEFNICETPKYRHFEMLYFSKLYGYHVFNTIRNK